MPYCFSYQAKPVFGNVTQMDNILTNSFKFHHKWESKNKCLIILIISLYAETTSKGTCVNEGYVEMDGLFYFENIKTKFFSMIWSCYM